jgi:hypothetical protein
MTIRIKTGICIAAGLVVVSMVLDHRQQVSQTVTQWPSGAVQTTTATSTSEWFGFQAGR